MVERSEIEPFELQSLLSADGDGPAPRIDAAAQARLIDNVLASAYAAPAQRPRAGNRTRKLGWAVAAAFVITGSAAAMYSAQRAREAEHRPAADASAAHRARPAMAPAKVAAPATDANANVAAPTTATDANTNVAAPVTDTNSGVAPGRRPAATTAAPHTKARVPSGSHDSAGEDLLKRANRLRGAGEYRSAESAYQGVVATDPHGAAAYAARVAAAGLRVEHLSDPRGALRLYADALRAEPNGALSPEIHDGMATAYRALGRTHDEQQTLRALLREQPSGPAAERARARLAVLDAHP